jgi:hypothetical protein
MQKTPVVKGGYGGKVPIVHTIIKKNLPGLKTIQSITLGITRKTNGRSGSVERHRGKLDCSMACVGKKSFSR